MATERLHSAEASIHVATDYSEYPGGRYRTDGPWSGEDFREEVLKPLLAKGHSLTVDFTGVFTVAPSFLDEAFGPLMSLYGQEKFDRLVEIRADDDPEVATELQRIRGNRFKK